MTDVQLFTALNALVPGLSVTGVLLVLLFWLLGGRLRSDREFLAMQTSLTKQMDDLRAAARLEADELRRQRDKYEVLAWQMSDVARGTLRTGERLLGDGNNPNDHPAQ